MIFFRLISKIIPYLCPEGGKGGKGGADIAITNYTIVLNNK